MTVIKKLIVELAANEADDPALKEKIDSTNLFRVFLLAVVAVPVSLINIAVFVTKLPKSTGTEHLWQKGIVYSHVSLAAIMVAVGIIAHLAQKKSRHHHLSTQLLSIITGFLMLGFGALLTAIDQMVTPAINPFIICICIVSATILLRPVHAASLYIAAFMLFQQTIGITQQDVSINLSNITNGFASVVIGMGLSFILWRTQVKRFEQDILIQKQTRQIEENYRKLIQFSDDLKEANQTKDKFFSIIAHDLKSPIGAMLGMLEVLQDDTINVSDEKRAHFLRTLSVSAQNTLKLLENLLLWARNQTGRIEFIPVPTELFNLIQDNIEVIHPQSSAKGIAIHNRVAPELMVNANREMLNTIFRNLLSNAVKYTRSNGRILIEARPEHGSAKNRTMIKIFVRDNGIGMSQEVLASLFRIDMRGSMRGTNDETGTGLGLIICKEFVERHGGKIRVEETSPDGSTFSFTLPAI